MRKEDAGRQFESSQKRIEAAIKTRKEMHAVQTALAEADAKMEVLQNYETHKQTGAALEVATSLPKGR